MRRQVTAFRVLVCGGRDYVEEWNVFRVLQELWDEHGMELVVIEGGARGADAAAATWADAWHQSGRNVAHLQFRANWLQHGKSAGPRRNQRMIDEGRPDLVVGFPGGVGTRDMLRRARSSGIEVKEIE